MQCVDCVREQERAAPTARSIFGGRATDGRPLVTYTLIAMCVVAFLGQQFSSRVTAEMAFVPLLGTTEPWRFVSAAFVHAPNQIFHILFNMYALWFCGQYLEPLLGRARFLALFVTSAIGGSLAFMAFAAFQPAGGEWRLWLTPTVGASGAVFGLFAAVVVLNRRLGRDVGPMIGLIAVNAAIPFFFGGIAWQAHLGGAITGALLSGAIAWSGRERSRWLWTAVAGFLVVTGVAAVWLNNHVVSQVHFL